jgi:hypothetical protein
MSLMSLVLSLLLENGQEDIKCRYIYFTFGGEKQPPLESLHEQIKAAVAKMDAKIPISNYNENNVYLKTKGANYHIEYERGDLLVSVSQVGENWNIVVTHASALVEASADTAALDDCEDGLCRTKGPQAQEDFDHVFRNATMALNKICESRGHAEGLEKMQSPLKRIDLERTAAELQAAADALADMHDDFHIDHEAIQEIHQKLGVLSETVQTLDEDIEDIMVLTDVKPAVEQLDVMVNKKRPRLEPAQRAGAIAGTAVGLALGAVGTSLLAINGRCVRTLGDPHEDPPCRHIYLTNLAGATFLGAGVLSIGVSGILVTAWLTSPKWGVAEAGLSLQMRF